MAEPRFDSAPRALLAPPTSVRREGVDNVLILCLFYFFPARRYGGVYTPKESEMPEDPKEMLEKAAHPKCASVWETYKKCEVRIEKKGSGDCAGYYVSPRRTIAQPRG